MNNTEVIIKLTPAEKYYKNHLRHVSEYQKRNSEKMCEKSRRAYDKMRENPIAYALFLEKRKIYHQTYKLKKEQTRKIAANIE
jgi:hypothetical protein